MSNLRYAITRIPLFLLTFLAPAGAQWTPMNPVTSVQQQSDGVVFTMQSGTMKVQVCTDSIIHILYSATASFPEQKDYVITKTAWAASPWTLQSTDDEVTLSTAQLKVVVSRKDGAITYRDPTGHQLVQEATRRLTPAKINGEDTYRAESFLNVYGSHEAFYGLGQHQGGVWNYRGESVDISQDNTNIAVPFLVSSNGYGIFWNNDSRSRFNNRFSNYLYVSSEVADVIDYYFFYGPELDKVVSDYRELTG
jgi:alpha-D-xyloside xylohydrolase